MKTPQPCAWLTTIGLLVPVSSFAYVGPGAGITMLGSLWGLIIAVVFIVVGLLILPVKIMRNKMQQQKAEDDAEEPAEQAQATLAEEDTASKPE